MIQFNMRNVHTFKIYRIIAFHIDILYKLIKFKINVRSQSLKKTKTIKKIKTQNGIKNHMHQHRNFVENFGGWRTFHFRVICNITYTIGVNRNGAKESER